MPRRSRRTLLDVVLLMIAALVFVAPGFLGGRVLAPAGDGQAYYYPVRVHAAQLARAGQWPIWSRQLYGGFPLLADIEVGVLYPPNWLFLALPGGTAMNFVVIFTLWVAGGGCYLYARAIRLGRGGAVLAALAYMLGSYLTHSIVHITLMTGAAWLPLVLFFLERHRRRPALGAVAGGAVALGLLLLGSHPQASLYALIGVACHATFMAIFAPGQRGRVLLGAMQIAVIGVMLAAAQLAASFELAGLSTRRSLDRAAFLEGSMPPIFFGGLLVPHLFWGPPDRFQAVEGGAYRLGIGPVSAAPPYLGIVSLVLVACSVPELRRSRHARVWWAMAFLASLLLLGAHTPLHRLAYSLPGYNLFRIPSRCLFLLELALAILSGIGWRHAARSSARLYRPVAGVAALLVCLTAVLVTLGPRAFPSSGAMVFQATNPALWMPWVMAALSAATLLGARRRAALAATVLWVDLAYAGQLNYGTFSCRTQAELEVAPPAVRYLQALRGAAPWHRVLTHLQLWPPATSFDDLPAIAAPNRFLFHGVENVAGSSSMTLARYSRATDGFESYGVVPQHGLAFPRVLNLLGVRFVLIPESPSSSDRLNLTLAARQRFRAELLVPRVSATAVDFDVSAERGSAGGSAAFRAYAWTSTGEVLEEVVAARRGASEPLESRLRWYLGRRAVIERVGISLIGAEALLITEVTLSDEATGLVRRLSERPSHGLPVLLEAVDAEPHVDLVLPGTQATGFTFVGALGHSVDLGQGEPFARLTIQGKGGDTIDRLLRAGVDWSEWSWDDPELRDRVRHERAQVAESYPGPNGSEGHNYLARVDLGGRLSMVRAVLSALRPEISLTLVGVSIDDRSTGQSRPVSTTALRLSDGSRWRRLFDTARASIWENARPCPRAWLVSETRALTDDEILRTLRSGTLPDGAEFDSRRTALVEDAPQSRGLEPGEVTMVAESTTRTTLRTRARGASFLVFNEIDYAGWQARVDGRRVPMFRTDYLLRGVQLSPGQHVVQLAYCPVPLRLGLALSLLTLGALAGACLRRAIAPRGRG